MITCLVLTFLAVNFYKMIYTKEARPFFLFFFSSPPSVLVQLGAPSV